MEKIFETLAAATNPETAKMRSDLAHYEKMIKELEAKQNGGYTAQVAKSFYLGQVGGSGRNTARLNHIRSNELEKTIDRAVILTGLYKKRDGLQRDINYIESGRRDLDLKKKEETAILTAEYWRRLKPGDTVSVGITGAQVVITKKNAKSIETGSGCKWTATEIIGKKAASLL